MIRAKDIERLKNILWKLDIFSPYETSAYIDLIFALATNYAVKATTVVELNLSRFFKRQYSRSFGAIGGYFTSR